MANSENNVIQQLEKAIQEFDTSAHAENIGTVESAGDGVAWASGLSEVMAGEMVVFEKTEQEPVYGLALNLNETLTGIAVMGNWQSVEEGDTVKRTGKILQVPVGPELAGRVVNALGEPLDEKGGIGAQSQDIIEKIAPGVIERDEVDTPLQTGIKAIDSMIPIGRGQRELIIGDRQTGKTAIAIDTILNQKNENVHCIYVAIGQKFAETAQMIAQLEEAGAMEYTTVVVANSSDPAPLRYIAPYTGTTIGEYFRDNSQDALVVYDDLTKHADAYREISLILRRPPGREAYPGDVFYLHSRLLERSGKLHSDAGGGSLTSLPLIETQAGDISAFIPTNVISITDGQIYLETDLFYQGIRPALNVGRSVSRVGSSAQIKAMKEVAGKLRLDLAQYRELAAFAQFGSELDENTRQQIARGERLTETLKQKQFQPLPVEEQIVAIYMANQGYLTDIETEQVQTFEEQFLEYMRTQKSDLLKNIKEKKELTENLENELQQAIQDFKTTFNDSTN